MSARDDYPLLTLVPGASDPIGRQTWRQGLAALDEIDQLRAARADTFEQHAASYIDAVIAINRNHGMGECPHAVRALAIASAAHTARSLVARCPQPPVSRGEEIEA